MDTIIAARGVVVGADHRRLDRPGQDAATALVAGGGRVGVAVVCDGCGSTPAAQVGSELGARLFASAIATALAGGASAADPDVWAAARASVVARLASVAAATFDPPATIHDLFLFTVVAGATDGTTAAVWAIGDGHYVLDGHPATLGPFADNRPPYLGYDLLGDPRAAVLVTAPARAAGALVVATDGAAPLPLAALADDSRLVAHPDALRRYLALRCKPAEEIDWIAQRVVRTPALLADDCAVAILRWRSADGGAR
jgi:hypothetical protein